MDCSTLHLCSADIPGPFLFTPHSLLLENTLITDLSQITGKGQQSITYSDEKGDILREGNTLPLDTKGSISPKNLRINGQYHCWSSPNKRIYFNVFTKNSSKFICMTGAKLHEYCVLIIYSLRTHNLEFTHAHLSTAALPTPIIHTSAGEWNFTSSQSGKKRYIVEVECSVRNMTFVEKYVSVSANSGETGRVAIDESCFGGLGQLYRVKVWAVSGRNISQQPAVRCLTPDGQCREGIIL